jgi:hypothetical protein
MQMFIRWTLCMTLMATAALGEWKRYVHSEYEIVDSPSAHDLAYFRLDPCSRDDVNDRVIQCGSPEENAKTHTEVNLVGRIGAYSVYDLQYFLARGGAKVSMRSVLVETAPNQIHEIHVRESWDGTISLARILSAGQQSIIGVTFDDGGMYHIVYEDYYVISKGVAVLLDFKTAFDAASRVVPRGMDTYQPTSRFDFKALLFHIRTETMDRNVAANMACCEGRIEVPFTIKEGRVIAGKAKYFPE